MVKGRGAGLRAPVFRRIPPPPRAAPGRACRTARYCAAHEILRFQDIIWKDVWPAGQAKLRARSQRQPLPNNSQSYSASRAPIDSTQSRTFSLLPLDYCYQRLRLRAPCSNTNNKKTGGGKTSLRRRARPGSGHVRRARHAGRGRSGEPLRGGPAAGGGGPSKSDFWAGRPLT
jgi:hypothetical protein